MSSSDPSAATPRPLTQGALVLLACLAGSVALAIWAPGGKTDWEMQAQEGARKGAIIAAVLITGLLAIFPWWGRTHKSADDAQVFDTVPHPKWFWPLVAAAVLLGGALRWNFAHGSMWWDELWNVRNTTVGEFRPDPKQPEVIKFRPVNFKRALWNYNKPANHPPVSVLSHASHLVWAKATGAKEGEFNEFALRLPVVLAGLAGIGLAAILLRRWGEPVAGVTAAFLLALHPWAIRYGADARAYGFLLFLVPFACLCVTNLAAQPQRLRWFWLLGLTQFLLIWSHPLSLYLCLALFLAAAILLWSQARGFARRRLLGRLVAVHLFGAALACIVMLPLLTQAAHWEERNQDAHTLDGPYFLSTLSQTAFGVEHSWADSPETKGLVSLATLAFEISWIGWTALALFHLLVLLGLVWLWKHHRPGAVILTCVLGSGVLLLATIAATGFYFYHRFIIGLSVPLVLLAALAAGGIKGTGESRKRALAAGFAAVALLVFYAALVLPQLRLLASRSYTPWREAAEALRHEATKGAKPRVIGFGHGGDALEVYYPGITIVKDHPREALLKAAKEAEAAGESLYVCHAYPNLHEARLPEGMELLRDPTQFVKVGEWFGIEPEFTVRIFMHLQAPPR